MTDPAYRHITILVDRSGSMQDKREDTEGGLAAFLADQAQLPGRATCSLHQFDTEYEPVYEMTPLADVPRYHLRPRGGTALLDAIGRTITATGEHLAAMDEQDRPGSVLLVIVTDGCENASLEYRRDQIKGMIAHQQEVYGWTFVFLGADQDAITAAGDIGIGRDQALSYAGTHTAAAFGSLSAVGLRGATGLGYQFSAAERATASGLGVGLLDTQAVTGDGADGDE